MLGRCILYFNFDNAGRGNCEHKTSKKEKKD